MYDGQPIKTQPPICLVVQGTYGVPGADAGLMDSQQILDRVFISAASRAGLALARLDVTPLLNLYDQVLLDQIVLSDLVVFDMAGHSLELGYLLGIRIAFRPAETIVIGPEWELHRLRDVGQKVIPYTVAPKGVLHPNVEETLRDELTQLCLTIV